MRKLYGSTSWRRVLALALVFVMMFSIMGTSGYSVFAEDLPETSEEVVVSEPEAVTPEVTVDDQGPSPGAEEVTEPVEPAAADEEPVEAVEEAAEVEEAEEPAEAVEEAEEAEDPAEEDAEPVEQAEEAIEDEEVEEPAEAAEEAEESEELELVEDEEIVEEEEDPEEEAVSEDSSEPTLVEEASQIVAEDDGSECEDPEAVAEPSVISDTAQLILDALTQEGEAALEELLEEELAEEELLEEPEVFFNEPMVKELDRIIVTVTPSEGAFREEVKLNVVPLPAHSHLYTEAEAALEESGVEYDGMLAYDISFRSVATGKSIEPEAPVSVEMEIMDKALAAVDSDNMDVESLKVTHIGSEATEAVADVADETDGSVSVSMSKDVVDGISAEFVVDSFSTFAITWKNADGDDESATIHWGTNEGEEFKEFDSTTTIDISASSVDLAVNIDGYYFAGAKYKTSETADGVVLGDSVIRKGTDGKWSVETVLYDDDGNATNETEPTTVAHGSHIYVYYAAKSGDSGYTPPGPAPATLNDIKPETQKNVESNGDGTYTIRLDVTGHATEDVKIGANVIVMLDMTYSMRQNDMNGTRIAAAKSALLSLIDALNPGYDADHPDLNLVNFTLATFGNTMNIDSELSWTQNRTAMENAVRGLSNSPGAMGTNWQGGLSGAETLAEAANNDSELKKNPTYVIFVTDGAPNCWQGHTSSSTGNDLDPAALPYAQTAANSLALDAIFYGVFCGPASGYNNLADMVNNAHGAGTINGASTTAMHDAFSQIAGEIVAGMAAANVTVDDGIPSLSNVSANVTAGEAGGFKYYIKPLGGTEKKWVAGATGDDDKGAPGATYDESNGVTWDLGEVGELQEGWVYSIEFTVWPSQEAYDTIADLNNGVKTMTQAELDAAGIGKNEDGTYYLLTNTHLNTTFTDPSGHVYDVVKENLVSEAMALPTETIGVQKIWNNKLDKKNPPAEVKLTLTKDGDNYLFGNNAIKVSAGNNWAVDDIYISLGQIRTTENGYEILETGHDYEIVELVGDNDYRWELTSEVYHPMVIDGSATMLIKDDDVTGTDGVDYYTIKTSKGSHKYTAPDEGGNMLRGWNDRRSWLQIEKKVTGTGANPNALDALFGFTVRIKDANNEPVWFSAYGPDGIIKNLTTNATPEAGETGYYYAASDSEITVSIKAGWTLRFLNLPSGTTYTVEETGFPDGFAFVEAEDRQVNDADEGVAQAEPSRPTITGKKAEGTINVPNVEFYVDYTNKYEETSVTVTKTWADGNNQDNIRPDALPLTLNGLPEGTTPPNPTVTKNGNTWTYIWSNLPKYIDGEEASYTVSEDTVPTGYSVSGSPADPNGTITNSHTPATTSVSITKSWSDADDQDGLRPTATEFAAKVHLYAGETIVEGATATVTDNGDGTYTVTYSNLPKMAAGTEINYTVKEDAINGYTTQNDTAANGGTITNSHTPATIAVSITKSWNDANDQDGVRPTATEFTAKVHLYAGGAIVEDAEATVTDNGDGTYTVTYSNLPKMAAGTEINYTVKEDAINGYTTQSDTAANGGTITNSHTPATTSVNITKSWNDANDQDGVRPTATEFTAKVHLYAGGAIVEDAEATVTDNGDGTYTVTYSNLPKMAAGTEISYTVKEDTINGYTTQSDTAANGETITNSHTPATIAVSITKSWNDANDQDGVRPTAAEFAAKVHLYAGGAIVEDAEATVTDNGDGTYTVTYSNLPKMAAGTEISYTVKEDAINGYTTQSDTAANGGTITNSHMPATTSVSITKSWSDADDQDGLRPTATEFAAKVHLYAGGTIVEGATATVTDNGDGTYTVTYSNLPKMAAGTEISYTVKEDTISGYTTQSDTAANGGTITNSHTPATIAVSITKSWNDANDQDGVRPTATEFTAKVHLYAGGAIVEDAEATVTDNGDGTYTVTYSNLPKMAAGTEISYTVKEDTINGYTTQSDTAANGGTITNTHTPDVTTVTVTKAWEGDYNNEFQKRPESISVQLKVGEEAVGDPVTLSINGGWSYKWENLPKYAGSTTPITYTVDEVSVPAGYTKAVSDPTTAADGSVSYTITNTYSATPVSVDPPVQKVFTGTEDLEDLYNNGRFTFTIANTAAPEGVTAPMPKNTEITNSSTYELANKPGYYEFGEIVFTVPGIYEYTVSESGSAPCVINDEASTKTITFTVKDNGDGKLAVTPTTDQVELTFTNKYEAMSVTVNKVWDDANNQDGKRPASITVQLKANGQAKGDPIELNEDNKWSATVEKLPVYEDGVEINYTWEEDKPAGYSLSTKTEETVTTLTNSYTPGKTSVNGTKTWNDENNQDGKRPASITVNLLADGEVIKTVTVGEAEKWQWEFTELPEYSNGKKITYTVEEDKVEGYESEVDGYNITNTHAVEKTYVTVTKTWSDYDNQYNTRPQSITVQLYANGKVCGDPVTITADNAGQDGKWTYTYTGLDKYEAGEEIVYTVTEEAVSGYTTTVNGLDITNSYVRNNPSRPPKPPVEEPDEPIEDPDTPLAPAEEEPDEEIPADDTPLAPYEEEPDEEVAEEPTPFSPYTGDDRHTAAWGFVSLLSLAGIAVVARKRREEE